MGLLTGTNSPKYSQYTAEQFVGNGSQIAFTLPRTPPSAASVIVTIDGVKQHSVTYSVSSNQVVFSEAPPAGTNIEVVFMGAAGVAYEPLDNSVTSQKLSIDSVSTTKIVDSSVTTPKLADGSVTKTKLDSLSSTGTGGLALPGGTTAQRPTGTGGELRYNSSVGLPEYNSGGSWYPFSRALHVYDFSKKATLVTGITDSGTTIVRTYTLSNYVTMPADTVAVVLRVRYVHNGSTNHGYFSFNAYQQGYSSNCNNYESQHYDWYYNTTNENIIVPWNNTTNWNLVIQCTSSYNSSSANTYSILLEGIIRGVNT